MNKEQFLLLKLSEECAEVAQRCSKQIQFGKYEVQSGQNLTNAERLKNEIVDFMSIVTLLQDAGEIPELGPAGPAFIEKKQKLQKYLKLSASLGTLPEIEL